MPIKIDPKTAAFGVLFAVNLDDLLLDGPVRGARRSDYAAALGVHLEERGCGDDGGFDYEQRRNNTDFRTLRQAARNWLIENTLVAMRPRDINTFGPA